MAMQCGSSFTAFVLTRSAVANTAVAPILSHLLTRD